MHSETSVLFFCSYTTEHEFFLVGLASKCPLSDKIPSNRQFWGTLRKERVEAPFNCRIVVEFGHHAYNLHRACFQHLNSSPFKKQKSWHSQNPAIPPGKTPHTPYGTFVWYRSALLGCSKIAQISMADTFRDSDSTLWSDKIFLMHDCPIPSHYINFVRVF